MGVWRDNVFIEQLCKPVKYSADTGSTFNCSHCPRLLYPAGNPLIEPVSAVQTTGASSVLADNPVGQPFKVYPGDIDRVLSNRRAIELEESDCKCQ